MKAIASIAAGACTVGVVIAATADGCGGAIVVGFDDAGVYHGADGAVLIPGSACRSWDGSRVQDGAPACDPDAAPKKSLCDPTDPCTQWIVPPALQAPLESSDPESCAVVGGCVAADGGGYCAAGLNTTWVDDSALRSPCPGGDAGDDFCRAFWGQFVAGGRSLAVCLDGVCFPGGNVICENFSDRFMAVEREDGGVSCVDPCVP